MSSQSNGWLTLAEAARLTPGRPHLATLRRWVTRGVRGHVLESRLIGGKRLTSHEALQNFFAAINQQPSIQSERTATTLHKEALADLAAEGILPCEDS